VIDANPKGVFEREAIRAAWRYKFKPKLVDGKPVEQVATLPFEFNLEK
jgi:protein TonB